MIRITRIDDKRVGPWCMQCDTHRAAVTLTGRKFGHRFPSVWALCDGCAIRTAHEMAMAVQVLRAG